MAAAAEPVRAAVAPKPHAGRFTASTITDEQLDALYAERDLLAAKVEALEADYGQVAADAMKHRFCDMRLFAQVRRAEQAEAAIAALDGPSPAPATPSAAPESHTGLLGAPGAPGGPR